MIDFLLYFCNVHVLQCGIGKKSVFGFRVLRAGLS